MSYRVMFVIAFVLAGMVGFAVGDDPSCSTQKCIEVGLMVKNNKNTLCWLTIYQETTKTFGGTAYGAQFAGNGYGTKAKKGCPDSEKTSFAYLCDGKSDCAPLGIVPVSGTVTTYGDLLNNVKFNTECKEKGGGS